MLKHSLLKLVALITKHQIYKWANNPETTQKKELKKLIKKGAKTVFGRDHKITSIKSYQDYKTQIPVRDYEDLKDYFEMIKKGKENILWPGKPRYLAITSGTTSGAKYIPITKDSLSNHLNGAKNALLMYIADTGNIRNSHG